MAFPFSLGDLFPLRGSRRAAQLAAMPKPSRQGRRLGAPARRRRFGFEAIEPRLLLSADISPSAELALTDGLTQFGQRIEQFLDAEDLLDSTRLPFILQVQKSDTGEQEQVAPTLGSLFSLQVDTNGDAAGGINATLLAWDAMGNGDGTVDAGEFIQALLINEATDADEFTDWLVDHSLIARSTANFAAFLADLGTLEMTFAQPGDPSVKVQLTVNGATDLTDPLMPAADLMFGVDFTLSVEQDLAIDLGTEADALKLLMYAGNYDAKKAPTIPVTSTLDFGFTFGVRVSGQASAGQTLDEYDFFVRKADDLVIAAESEVVASDDIDGIPNGFDFNLNIGFLGTTVNEATIDYAATVNTLLVDPDSPAVLGFTTGQYGAEQTTGVVIATNAVTSEDLAHGAGFVLRIGNAGISTQVDVVADDNVDLDGLLVDINGALGSFGLGGLVTASFDVSDHLVFTLVGTTDTPLGFANESYSAVGMLTATPDGAAYAGNDFEFDATQSFLLSVDGALPKLVAVRAPDPARSDIGFGATQSATLPGLIGQNAPNATGTLSNTVIVTIPLPPDGPEGDIDVPFTDTEANFTLKITKNDGTMVTQAVSVTESLTGANPNATVADLVADINTGLQNAGLNALVMASVSGGRIVLYRVGGAVSAIEVTAADAVTQNDIGFVSGQMTTLAITAASPVSNASLDDGDAATYDSARIGISVKTASGTTTSTLVVAPGSADAFALASAIDTALTNAGHAIDATLDASGRIVLTSHDASVLAFSIDTINDNIGKLVGDVNRALVQAGFDLSDVWAVADGTDLKLISAGGQSLEISHTLTLDAGVTYGEFETTPTATLFSPEPDADSNVSFKLPIDVLPGLGYDPQDVSIVGNFSPFGQLLIAPVVGPPAKPVATIGVDDDRFELHFNYTPTIAAQDTHVPDVSPSDPGLVEEIRLVNMAEPLNFNLITAESMVGLIMGMGSALQQIANSGTFSGYDIPFADAALADLLNYTDDDKLVFSGLIDSQLVYDTGGTGIDEPGGPADDHDKLLKRLVDINDPGNPDDDVAYLVPAFVTAQQLATRLDTILAGMTLTGVNGINAHYAPTTNELTYDLDLVSDARSTVGLMDANLKTAEWDPYTAAFEYDVDLGYFVKPTVDPAAPETSTVVTLKGLTGLNLTFGIDLSPPGATIDVTTPIAKLNSEKGIDVKTEAAATGTDGVRTVLSRTANISLIYGSDPAVWIVVPASATDDNRSIDDLVDDLNDAIDNTVYDTRVVAGIVDGKLTLSAVDGTTVLKVGAASNKDDLGNYTDPAFTELGFVPFYRSGTTVTAANLAKPMVGRLSGDATFKIDVAGDGLGELTVQVKQDTTAGNRTIMDLVDDVNDAIVAAYAAAGVTDTLLIKVKADYDVSDSGVSRLVISATDATTDFSVITSNATLAGTRAITELGLPTGTTAANDFDFLIHTRSGATYQIALDGLAAGATVQSLIDLINAQTPGNSVVADLNVNLNGLELKDNTTWNGSDTFRVETINGSNALISLGLFGAENVGTDYEILNGDETLIVGGTIGETRLDKRFFVRDAQMWGTVALQTPDGGVPGTALFGIVGVDTKLSGSLYTKFTADIKDPLTGTPGGTATLLQLFEGAKQGRLTQDATFNVSIGGATPVPITIAKTDMAANDTLADLVAGVNKKLKDASLDGQILARVAGTRIEFVSTVKDNLATSGIDESVGFTIHASGTGAQQLGLAGTLSSSLNLAGEQVVAAHSAARYAVDEVVVQPVYELAFDSYGLGEFAPGMTVYGWVDGPDADPWPDTLTGGAALVIGAEPGSLALTNVQGTFATATLLTNTPSLLTSTVAAWRGGGEAALRANFGEFTLHADVQAGFGDLGFADGDGTTSGFGLLAGKDYDVRFNITDFGNPYDPAPPVATFVDLPADTGDIYAFRNLDYADIGAALHGLLEVLNDVNDPVNGFDLLTFDLPGINKSIGDLLSLVDGFGRGVANMDDAFLVAQHALEPGVDLPALRLQDIPRALRGAFGLPQGVDPTAAGALDFVEFDFDKANGMLLADLNLHESIDTKLGLDIAVGSGLPNLTSAGVLKTNGTLDVDFQFGIDLTDPAKAYLFDDSRIAAELHVEGEGQRYETSSGDKAGMGLVFRASIGPLAVFIQDGDALIDAAFALPALDFGAGVQKKLIGDVAFEDFKAPAITKNDADIVLPMFYGGEGPDDYIGDFSAIGKLVDDPSTGSVEGPPVVTLPDFSSIQGGIAAGTITYDPFDNILLGLDTLNLYLELLSDDLAGDVLGVNLPFVGDQMADILFIENFRNTLYSTLKNGIANDIDPTPADITSLLTSALGSSVSNLHYHSDLSSATVADWYHQWDFTVSGSETIWLSDFVLGIPALDFDVDTAVKVELSWSIDIGFGVNFVEGAYIDLDLSDNVYDGSLFTFDGKDVELYLTITLEDGTHVGSLGFLQVQVSEDGPEGKPDNPSEPETLDNPETIDKTTGAKVDFTVDVVNVSSSAARLGFSDIGKLDAKAELFGRAIDGSSNILTLHLDGEMAGVGVLPRVSTNLEVDWFVQGSVPGTGKDLSTLTPDPVLAGLDRIAYTGMSMDGGSIVTDFLDPIFGKINEIIQPFMPVVDVLTAPIPVLSDLAGEPFTLLDLAEIFGSVDADFIKAVADILTLIDRFTDPGELPIDMPLGSVILYSRTGPDAGFDPFDADFELASIDPATLSPNVIKDPNGIDPVLTAFNAKVDGSDLLSGLRDGEFAEDLSLPILTDGFQSIGLLFGRNAVLVDYALPPLGVDFEYLQVFPVWGPLAVSIEISFGFTVDLHSVGYDTFGLQRYADGGYRNPGLIFDGFYLNDLDSEGVDAPEVTFEFGLVGAAELNLGIARAGVGGGIDANINFNWYDPIADGRVHISEMIANVETADPGPNPLAVFDVSGALTFQLFAFIEITLLGIEEEFPITPKTELFSFNETFDHEPVWATDIGGGNLVLNIGPSSKDRIYGDISDGAETVTVAVSATNEVTVNGKNYGTFSHIIGIGGQGDDSITLNLDANSTITYELEGGIGDDVITVTGGKGGGTILGGVGNDSLTGGDGNDVITGGEGNDTIQGGGGHDILFGDQGRVVDSAYAASPYVTSRVTLADGADEIHGGAGDDVAIGAGGNDKLFGDGGGDILIGDGGRFEFAWAAPGQINIASLRPTAFVAPPIVTDDPMTPQEISSAIDAIYDGIVAKFHATDLFYGGNDEIEGGADGDMIFGGSGDDLIKGDGGGDFILAGKGFDEVFGGADNDHIFGNDQADIISGDGGDDVVSGGSGNDYIHGNDGNDVMKGDSGADVMFGDANDDQIFGQTEPDILFGGIGNDLVVGGTSNDVMFGDDGLVAKLGMGGKIVYNDLVITPPILIDLLGSVVTAEGTFWDADTRTVDLILTYVAAGDGNDIMSGDAADDIMLGGGGNDLMGGDVDPRLPNAGGPTDISEDVLIGDGGIITFDQRRFRSIATVIDPVGPVVPVANDKFDDTIYGDNGNDYLFGGWGSDFLFGGHGKVVDLTAADGQEVKGSRGATDNGASDNDIIVGDNGEIRFADETIAANFGIKELIRTTDTSNSTGGHEYVEGELGNDVIFGGVNASVDVLFGSAGSDVILGDNGELDFAYGTDTDLDTLDLIRSYRDGLGGEDWVSGNQGGDVLIGGTGGDKMYGDDASASSGALDGEDIMLGDNADVWLMGTQGRLDVQVAEMTTGTAVYMITTTDAIDASHVDKAAAEACGGADTMSGNAGNDIMFGGVNNDDGIALNGIEKDRLYGDRVSPNATTIANDGDDILLGDNGLLSFSFDPIILTAAVAAETSLPADVAFNVAINHDAAVVVTVDAGSYGNLVNLLAAVNDALETAGLDDLMLAQAAGGAIALRAIDPSVARVAVTAVVGNKLGFGPQQTVASGAGQQVLDLIRSFEDDLGGADIISGNKGSDVAVGGTAGDEIFGDDVGATATGSDLGDMLLGDNADIFLVDAGDAAGGDLKKVLDAAVKTIRTTDEEHPEYGGRDTISGNAGGDIIAGGVQGDLLYGDALVTVPTLDGNDIMLGDNAALEWLSTGRVSEISGIDIGANNPALWTKYGGGVTADADLTTLDLITTEQPTQGGRDTMYGDEGEDLMFGGTDVDVMFGDDGDGSTETDAGNGDLMFGDHGRVYPQFSFVQVGNTLQLSPGFPSRNFFAIDIGASRGGQGDVMYGEEGDDVMLGQQGDDRMWGGLDDDDMIGGHNVAGGVDELVGAIAGTLVVDDAPDVGMNDLMDGDEGDDAMTGDNAIVWRRGDDLSPRFRLLTDLDADGSTLDTPIYSTTNGTITVNASAASQSDPANAIGRDIELLDHGDAVQATPLGRFGQDVMAGGADNDVMYGQLGDDLMQGDGSIDEPPYPSYAGLPMSVLRDVVIVDGGEIAPDPDLGQTVRFAVPEQASDGDDYMEGNGGRDLMYGGLGQDDMLGGSSALFGLTTNAMRPDDSDTMFGGAGTDLARNNIGDAITVSETIDGKTSTNIVQAIEDGHVRDADYMMGDNANVLRIVTTSDTFRTFNFDTSGSGAPADPDDYDGTLRIVPRAMVQLDYTLGGSDFAGDKAGQYVNGSADLDSDGSADDNGAADLIHGESGDDIIFGMTGSDVLFGEGQNDDIVGGYGHDWISSGTGQDGVLGDDGVIYTSRNSTAGEPLYGIAGLLASDADNRYSNGNALDEAISTPGGIQTAVINKSGELKKTADLVPFSVENGWMARDDEFPDNQDARPFADDIIFGGWGSDWLHGGSGDDAISGAEALAAAYVPDYNNIVVGNLIDLGYLNVGIASALVVNPTQQNPGNVLFFHSEDTDGQHLNNRFRAGEFDLYDEYNPRVKILLDANGQPTLDGTGSEFLLNFRAPNGLYDAAATTPEGVRRPAGTVPKATGQQTESYPWVDDDGADAIFGDLGNDWLVGGSGRDNVYGGWGNDLLQVDDYLNTQTVDLGPQDDIDAAYDNEAPDTHPTYEDRAYGGAGRDVLIGNTGGDRLIDWVGEYNSYLVPYAPFGQASVSRTLQPFLPEFLYALSAGDGADPTRYADAIGSVPPAPTNNNPIPSRNGEPHGELGLVLQKDFAWGDQTGAPADPQAGNIPGGPRDVLRSATFAGNNADSFVAAAGTWTVVNNAYEVAPEAGSANRDAISLFNADVTVPSYFEITATINALKPVAGFKANAYIIFDYYSPTDFKFAGINVSTNKIEIGQRASWGFQVLASKNMLLKAGTDYNVLVAINGSVVTFVVNNAQSVSHAFAPRLDADGITTYGINAGMYGLGADNGKARIDNVFVQRIPPKVTLTMTDEFTGTAPALLTPDGAGWSVQGGRLLATPASGAPFALAGNDIAVSAASILQLGTTLSATGVGGIVFDMYTPTDFKWAAVSKATNQVLVGHYTAKAGWVVDAAVSRTIAEGDNTLAVTLRGTTVTVSLNGQQVLSRIYNANVVDGAVGLFSRMGTTSFDQFTLATDDPRFAAPTEALASVSSGSGATLAPSTASRLSLTSAQPAGDTAAAMTSTPGSSDAGQARMADLPVGRSREVIGTEADVGNARAGTARPDAERQSGSWNVMLRRPVAAALAAERPVDAARGPASAPIEEAPARGLAATPAINWTLDAVTRSGAIGLCAGSANWHEGFLNDLGRKRMNPNSKLRVTL